MSATHPFVRPLGEYGTALQPEDYAALERSWISRAIADSARMRRVTSEEGKELVGRRDCEDYSGLVFPYFWPGNPVVFAHRIRRDNPPFEIHAGQRRERDKYMSAPGYGNGIYFHPLTPPEALADVTTPLVLTEGQKKCLALFRLAHEGCAETQETVQFIPAGVNGVYGWKDRREKQTGPTGKRMSVSGPVAQLGLITWEGRRVYILFDSNVLTNPMVAEARNQFAQELAGRGAEVLLIDLPAEDGINGIDDYLAKHGPEPAMKLIAQARLFDPNERLTRLHYTDLGNEQAFEILYGDDFLYNWTSKQWLQFDGIIWRPDVIGSADRAMVEVAAARLQATHKVQEDAAQFEKTGDIRLNQKKAISAALMLQNIRNRESALASASTNPRFARRAEEFELDDYLLACGNGVLDLRDGGFRAGRREDMLTRATPVYWVAEAKCERWLKFLSEIFPGRPDMIAFLKRAVGYSLTGLTRDEVFFILYGLGRNGKDTFLRVLSAMLGDYAANTEFSTLIADRDRGKGPRNDIASIAGRRLVTAQESREGAQFDESLIKALTGGDLITARFLHKEFFTFRPTWKIWLATNHKPEIHGTDNGIWSRPKLIPFTITFDGREDRGLKDALLDPLGLSGILCWAAEGCREYLAEGLRYPEEVLVATANYKAESDLVGQFIADCCVQCEYARSKATPLYLAFSKWADGSDVMSQTAFSRRIVEKGFEKQHKEAGNEYLGLGLLDVRIKE
jgi:P4 family phage/plasmid primase-like protien